MGLRLCWQAQERMPMWIAAVIVAYLTLSLVAALISYCTAAIASRTSENPSQENELAALQRPADFPARPTETGTLAGNSTAQEAAAQSQ
jgi:hypothetical protein